MKTENTPKTTNETPEWVLEKVEQLKKEHALKDVFVASAVDEEDKPLYCFLKKPTRQVISASQSVLSMNDPVRSDEILLAGCWLDGDSRFKDDDDYFFGVIPTLRTIVSYKVAQLKKY